MNGGKWGYMGARSRLPTPCKGDPLLLRFGLPSPGAVGMVMAPGSASGKHPYVVCRCDLGCCMCGGRRVRLGRGGVVMLNVRALFAPPSPPPPRKTQHAQWLQTREHRAKPDTNKQLHIEEEI